jgi:hypothetical protein
MVAVSAGHREIHLTAILRQGSDCIAVQAIPEEVRESCRQATQGLTYICEAGRFIYSVLPGDREN